MRSTFSGFDIARRAIVAQQQALEVTGHNIANAATPGYSRQRANLTASNPYTIPSMHRPNSAGQIGTGVEVASVTRLRDEFTDYQYRSENQSLGNWEAQWQTLDRVEGIFAEPAAAGLKKAIGEFFNAWQDLSRDAGSDTVRAVVRQRGAAVSDMFRHIHKQLDDTRVDINEGIRLAVDDINSLAEQISALNVQVQSSELGGHRANDLRDKRDLLVDKLSGLVNINVFDENGQFAVVVNGTSLVRHGAVTHMKLSLNQTSPGVREVVWEKADGTEGLPVRATNGRLAGLTSSRDQVMHNFMGALDDLANKFADEVNRIHGTGWYVREGADLDNLQDADWLSGMDFFASANGDPISASSIIINPDISDSAEGRRKIAAAGTKVTGDGAIALQLGQLRNQEIPGLNGTAEQRYEGILGVLGVESQKAQRLMNNQTMLVDQLDMRRQSVSGVSLDEEMTDMIRYQHAYNAAARLITTMDEVLDVLINRTGMR